MANTVTGNTGKQYTYNNDGSITVNRPDGSSSTVRQGDATWNATNNAIAADTKQPASTISTSSTGATSYTPQAKVSSNYLTGGSNVSSNGQVSGYTNGTNTYNYGNTGASKINADQYNNSMSGWTSAGTGATGKSYSLSNTNNAIQVQYADGSVRTVTPGMADYNNTYSAMQKDLQGAGIGYTPTITTERTVPTYEYNGNGFVQGPDENLKYQTVNYLTGNENLQNEYRNWVAENNGYGQNGYSLNDYINNLYRNATSADQLNSDLIGLGLNDYTTDKAHYTMSGKVLPGGNANQYGYESSNDPHIIVNGQPQAGEYWTYGGQTYLTGGDSGMLSQYANAKAGKLTSTDYLLGNLTNNPYIMGDPQLAPQIISNLNSYNIGNTAQGSQTATNPNGYYTGNVNVDRTISSINNMIDFAITTGDSDLYNSIKELLDNGLNTTQEWIASQKSQAEANAEKQARSARVNQLLQQQAMNEAYSSAGIGTTGAVQSGMQAINDSYGRSLGDINNNLASLLGNLNDQELKALGDYYQNLGQYKYNITNDDLNRQYQLAQMEQSQQQFNANMAMQQQELAWKQQQAEADRQWQEKVYNDSLEQSRLAAEADAYQQQYDANISQRDYALKAIQAGYTSPELAAALGIPYNEALALAQQYAAKNTYYKGSTSSGGGGNPSSDLIGPDEGIYTQNPIYAPGYYVNSTDLNQQYQNGILPLDQNGMPITQASLMAGLYDPLTRR